MANDYRDKIEQIRARRGRELQMGGFGAGGAGNSPYGQNNGVGSGAPVKSGVKISRMGEVDEHSTRKVGPDFKSPWLQDRISLSLQGQIEMMEQRNNFKASAVDLGYTNRIPILALRPGVYVEIEPPGTYRLVYHQR